MMSGNLVLVEKYRPEVIDDVVGQPKVTNRLKVYIADGNMPNLLFAGPPGVGKTACAVSLAKELYGESFSANFSELNASDDRGINVVRTTIKNTANTKPIDDFDFKIIFLDEGDALTSDAQSALRRTMEKYAENCRFILSCNYPSKIIEPIVSRFSVFQFSRLKDEDIKKQLLKIIGIEDYILASSDFDDIIDTILYAAEGDMRKAISTLQAAAIGTDIITKEIVLATSVIINKEFVKKMVDSAFDGKFIESKNYLVNLMFDDGLSGEDIIKGILKYLLNSAIPDVILSSMLEVVGEIDFRLTEGANEYIQLNTLLAHFVSIGDKHT